LLKALVKNNISFIFDRLAPCPFDFLEVIGGGQSKSGGEVDSQKAEERYDG
jgi:hypothetical protein